MVPTVRAFIALALPDEVKAQIHQQLLPLQTQFPSMRWYRPTNYHLTLLFIAALPTEQVEALWNDLLIVILQTLRISLTLSSLIFLPNTKHPHVVALEGEPQAPLTLLAKQVAEVAMRHGIDGPRHPFKPHITVARCHQREEFTLQDQLILPTFNCLEVTLFESLTTPEGPLYRPLESGLLKA